MEREEAEKVCADFLELLGIDPTLSPEELRRIDSRRLIPASSKKTMTPGPLIYDGYWIPNRKLADTVRQQGYPYDYLAGSNLGESHLNSMELGGVYGIRKASEFYAFAKEMLGNLYEKYDFENLVQVTDENVDRATPASGLPGPQHDPAHGGRGHQPALWPCAPGKGAGAEDLYLSVHPGAAPSAGGSGHHAGPGPADELAFQ